MLAARVAGEMPPERAAELANRMPVEYLAEGWCTWTRGGRSR